MALPNPGMNFTPFDKLPASDLNKIVANIESLANGTAYDKIIYTSLTATTESTTSVTYVDTAVSITGAFTVKNVKITLTALPYNSGTTNDSFLSFRISGATTTASSDANGIVHTGIAGSQFSRSLILPINAGSNTFTLVKRASAGTATFIIPSIIIEPIYNI